MKYLIPLVCVFLGWGAAWAQEAAEGDPAKLEGFEKMPPDFSEFNIHIEVLVVQIPTTAAAKLVPQLRDPKQTEAAYAAVLDLVTAERARVIDWPMAIVKAGTDTTVGATEEFRYAESFTAGRTVKEKRAAYLGDQPLFFDQLVGEIQKALTIRENVVFDPIPDHFETRNLGVTFQVKPTIDPRTQRIGTWIDCKHASLEGMTKTTIETGGRKITVEQPRFHHFGTQTEFSTRSGQRMLFGTFLVPGTPSQTELFLYQATARPVPK